MAMEVITLQTEAFKKIVGEIGEIKSLLTDRNDQERANKWLTSEEVLEILKVSPKTLQSYRDKRLISFSQIGNKIYYRQADVDAFLDSFHIKRRGGAL